jgi:hypothetical protein
MKNLKNIVAIAAVAISLSACGGSSEQKTIGGSVDTMNSVEGSNAGNETTGSPMTDTTANQNGQSTGNSGTNSDSTSNTEGNAKPDGRPQQ